MKKNVALFGLGRIGVMHAKNITQNSKLKLKFVYDINQKISKIYSKKFKCTYLKNPSKAFSDKTIDIIFISSFLTLNLFKIFSIESLF